MIPLGEDAVLICDMMPCAAFFFGLSPMGPGQGFKPQLRPGSPCLFITFVGFTQVLKHAGVHPQRNSVEVR